MKNYERNAFTAHGEECSSDPNLRHVIPTEPTKSEMRSPQRGNLSHVEKCPRLWFLLIFFLPSC